MVRNVTKEIKVKKMTKKNMREIIMKELWYFRKEEEGPVVPCKSYYVPTEIILELTDSLVKKLLKLKKEK